MFIYLQAFSYQNGAFKLFRIFSKCNNKMSSVAEDPRSSPCTANVIYKATIYRPERVDLKLSVEGDNGRCSVLPSVAVIM